MLKSLTKSQFFKDPIHIVLILSFLMFFIGISWGLPHYTTWLSDSLAPHYPVFGLITKAFSFGFFTKYPLVHHVILSILNLPIIFVAGIQTLITKGFNVDHFLGLFRSVEYSTALTLVDRFASVVMGTLIIYIVYLSVKEIFNERAAIFAAIITALNPILNLYSHLTKVEVPYIFWAFIGLYFLIRVVKYEKTKDYILCALFVCLSFGSKDQAFAIFILPLISYLMIYQMVFREKKERIFNIIIRKNTLLFLLSFVISFVIVENLILNFSGFMSRLDLLTGDAGFRSARYVYSFSGIVSLFKDMMSGIMRNGVSVPFFILSIYGIISIFIKYNKENKRILLGLIFVIAALSYYLFFILIVRQVSMRFRLPISLFLGIYGGIGIDHLYDLLKSKYKHILTAFIVLSIIYAFYLTVSVNAHFFLDVRYSTEKWMNENIPENSKVEHYSGIKNLPRFPKNIIHYRVKSDFMNIKSRDPDYLVLTSKYYGNYTGNIDQEIVKGRKTITDKNVKKREYGMSEFFNSLFNNELNYRLEKRFEKKIYFFHDVGMFPTAILIFKRYDN